MSRFGYTSEKQKKEYVLAAVLLLTLFLASLKYFEDRKISKKAVENLEAIVDSSSTLREKTSILLQAQHSESQRIRDFAVWKLSTLDPLLP